MRTLILAGLAAVAVLLAVWLEPPARKTGAAAVTGARLVRVSRSAVRRFDLQLGPVRLVAERAAAGWTIDQRPAEPAVISALDDLTTTLVDLRAVDQFRGAMQQSFGFEAPRGTIIVTTRRRSVRLVLGAFTASTATLYARRDGDPRVFQVGSYLLSALSRVIDQRGRPPSA